MFKWLAGLFSKERRARFDKDAIDFCYQRGFDMARSAFARAEGRSRKFQSELVYEYRARSDGQFNTNEREKAFDRGVRDACNMYEKEHGAS